MNIAGFYNESIVNGTGLRAVIFVSGCPHHCKGCHNPQTWDECYGELFDEDKYYKIITDNKLLTGVTLSGGEPLTYHHIKELLPFIKRLKANTKLDIWCYTGYTLEELINRNDKYTKEILNLIDVIVDGPFIEQMKDPLLVFRGSSNQRIINLSDVYKEGKDIV